MPKNRKKFLIIDGNALIHRSFHALPLTMTTKDGIVVNALYGFMTVLLRAIREFRPEYVALTLDKAGPTFRHKKFSEYKAKRVKAPQELYDQIPLVKELAEAFNIPVFEKDGFEADDLIGTLASKTDKYTENIIATGDMDALQLVDYHTRVYKLGKGIGEATLFDSEVTRSHYGFSPDQVVDYKALRGDPSDNIPGVRGVGEKTALELLGHFRTLDGIYKNIDSEKIKERVRGLLMEHKKEAYLSRDLATIRRDVKIDFSLDKALFSDFRKDDVVDFAGRMEFNSLLPRLHQLFGGLAGNEEKKESAKDKYERNRNVFKYKLINTEKDFRSFLGRLKREKYFAFDTETSSFDPITSDFLGISFSWKEGEAYYMNVKCQSSNAKPAKEDSNLFNYKIQSKVGSQKSGVKSQESKVNSHPWLEDLQPVFEDEKIKKCAHNGKFDIRVLRNNGINVSGFVFDTMVASYLLNPGTRQHSLDALAFTELKHEKITKDDLLGTGREKVSFSEAPLEKLYLYSAEDADFTFRLAGKLEKSLKKNRLFKLFSDIEMPLVEVLVDMEENGVKIDRKFLKEMSVEMKKKILATEKKIYDIAGQEFNIRSTQQLKEILFEKLGISAAGLKKTKTGISTAADELDKLKDKHPIILLIQEHREFSKLVSTYIDALPKLINKKTGRVHTSFNQAVTSTGRLSSTEPNLQNIPIRTDLGKGIRKAFIAEKGYRIVCLDYSQIELRLAAHMSGDKKMIKAFEAGADIHTSTAAEINQISPESVTSEIRREAKAINFGVIYGQGPYGLSRSADIPFAQAREFIEQYFAVYSGIKKHIDDTIRSAREKGYVETLFGRIRYLPEINSTVGMVQKAAERMAINAPLQGTSADITKIAMIRVNKMIEEKYPESAGMILQVHDELVFEVRDKVAEEFAEAAGEIMEKVVKLKVPVVVDAKIGNNWGEMQNLEVK